MTCVIDANTLIDHIHEVKALVYDGHIQLCVALTTMGRIDQICKKFIEPKPEPEKAPPPRSGGKPKSARGKPAREKPAKEKPAREKPARDINPQIAQEFLERSKQGDEELAVEFQKEEEQFTVWKNLELQEEQEKQKNADGKPATFAEALLAKLNIAEAPAESLKGPVKPKLVAMGSGANKSPWKKAVPSIAAEGVPLSLRPFLGYLLWRLHERETYSFTKDSSILISDNKETIDVGTKLGVTAKTFAALRAQILSQNGPLPDVATSAALDRDFDPQAKRVPASRIGEWLQVEFETGAEAPMPKSPSPVNGARRVPKLVEDLGLPKEVDEIETQENHVEENVARPVNDVETSNEPDRIVTQENNAEENLARPISDVKISNGLEQIGIQENNVEEKYAGPINDVETSNEPDRVGTQEDNAEENLARPINDVEMLKEPDKIDTQVDQIGNDSLELVQPQNASLELLTKNKAEELDREEKNYVTHRAWADVVSNRTRPAQPKSPLPVPTALAQTSAADIIPDRSINALDDPVAQEKTSNILDWVQKVKATTIKETDAQISLPAHRKHRSRKSKELTPPPEETPKPFRPVLMQRPPTASQVASENRSSQVASENAHSQIISDKPLSPSCTPPIENGIRGGLAKHTPNVSVSSARSASIKGPTSEHLSTEAPRPEVTAVNEPEDSEEEVVVFNPRAKRLSAQKQQVSKQITPEWHSQIHEPASLPVEAPPKQQAQSPKPASPERTSQAKPRKQPKPRAPVVIDPDAFGRDFASNPRSTHQHQRPHPHGRGGFQQGPPRRPLSQHGPSPDRHAPQQGPSMQRPVSQHGPPRPQPRGGRVHQQGQLRRNEQADMNGPTGYAPNLQAEPNNTEGHPPNVQSGSDRMNGNVPKSPAGPNGPNGNPLNAKNGQTRPTNGAARNSPPREPIVETTGPDVDFVLKTGSTRASTRGRGRLWVP